MRAALGTTAVVVFLAVALSQLGPQLMPSESGAGTPVAETPPVDTLPTATSWPRGKMESPEYGMQAFLWWDRHAAERDLELIRDAGFGWVKQNAPWREVEGAAKGAFNWYFTDRIVDSAESYGLDILLRLDSEPLWAVRSDSVGTANGPPENPQDFGDFCRAMAERYRGRVRAYQVWNEPNLSREWGGWEPSPSEYVDLLRACYIGIKNGDPDAWVISAGLAPTGTTLPEAIPDDEFLTGMYEADCMRPDSRILPRHRSKKLPANTMVIASSASATSKTCAKSCWSTVMRANRWRYWRWGGPVTRFILSTPGLLFLRRRRLTTWSGRSTMPDSIGRHGLG
jgi:hypothetical protein